MLPIIFLRFLSMRYEKRREELEGPVNDQTSDYYTDDRETQQLILDDADEYRSAGAFVVPTKARWSYLLTNAQADDIKVNLDEALEELEKAYPRSLEAYCRGSMLALTCRERMLPGLAPSTSASAQGTYR